MFGDDYPTADGTCVRDYIHVEDLADAHVRALDYLAHGGESLALNVGTGVGSSVFEVLNAIERAAGRPVPYDVVERRAGDPAATFADPARALRMLGWKAAEDLIGASRAHSAGTRHRRTCRTDVQTSSANRGSRRVKIIQPSASETNAVTVTPR